VNDHLLAIHRRDATGEFWSTVRIERDSGETWDGENYVPVAETVHEGRATVRMERTSAVVVQAGDRPFNLRDLQVDVDPSWDVRINDRVVVVDSPDPLLADARLRVEKVGKTDWLTVRPLVCVEET
jgi:hypothetical protein